MNHRRSTNTLGLAAGLALGACATTTPPVEFMGTVPGTHTSSAGYGTVQSVKRVRQEYETIAGTSPGLDAVSYSVRLRMDRGGYQEMAQAGIGGLMVGDRVRVRGGAVQRY